MENLRNKRGQIAIWVILALVFVATIVILFFIMRKSPTISGNEFNPQNYISLCVKSAADEALGIMMPQGGFINPANFRLYKDIKVTYLCQNRGNYLPCINQHPLYINEMKNELTNYISPKVEGCFQSLKAELGTRNSAVELGEMNLSISLAPDRVFVNINREFKITNNGETQKFDKFNVGVISPLYNLGLVAAEIASQEAKYCYFEYVGYMILHPETEIDKVTLSDSTKIYSIKDTSSGSVLNIATRGCTIPPGV